MAVTPVPRPRNNARRGAACNSIGSSAWRASASTVALLPSCWRLLMCKLATPLASTMLTVANAPSARLTMRPPGGTSTRVGAGAHTARAATSASVAHCVGARHARARTNARYPTGTSNSASFAPIAGNSTTPNSHGATAAPSVLTPSTRPRLMPAAPAVAARWLNSAPIARVGNRKPRAANVASAASAALMFSPSVRSTPSRIGSASVSASVPARHAAASARSSRSRTGSCAALRASQRP